ncbi:MAG: efflux RND transporter periplasmic adaptor subunit [Kastovskya adunca ATA6-11-RM4]|nr:efflux RND transporter periplasmic adaptor subunit [Kastovskya adunca ATA6-11-RM4]
MNLTPPQIQALQSQVQSLKASGESLDLTISRYQKLAEQGAYPLEKVNELQRQKSAIEAQVWQQSTAVEMAKKQLRDELKARQDEYDRLVAQRRVAEQESMAARTSVTSQLPLVETLHKELAKRQNRQTQNQVLRAPKSGTVITQNLYPLKGKTLQKGEAVLEIADPSKLVAVIEVRQEDADLVKAGAIVKFNPPEPGLPSFTTQIKQVVTVLERDKMQQKSMLQVIAVIDSQGNQLKPGAKVYAKIASPEPIPLYEKCRREFFNLFKVRSL